MKNCYHEEFSFYRRTVVVDLAQLPEASRTYEVMAFEKPSGNELETFRTSSFNDAVDKYYSMVCNYKFQLLSVPADLKKSSKKSDPVNKFGVKVGDLFYAVWGYDATNVNFFQVIKLVGASSVRVREVKPKIIDCEWERDYSRSVLYENTKELLPATNYSCFIKDQENGDLKRIKSYASDGKSNPEFYVDTFCNASLFDGGLVYESER